MCQEEVGPPPGIWWYQYYCTTIFACKSLQEVPEIQHSESTVLVVVSHSAKEINSKCSSSLTGILARTSCMYAPWRGGSTTSDIYNLLFKSCRFAPQCLRKTESQQSTHQLYNNSCYVLLLFTTSQYVYNLHTM
jgi:hypothetical protein